METNEIKQLLEKYYEGSTTIAEEQILKDYFQDQSVAAGLETDKELFLYTTSESKTIILNSLLEDKLINLIDKQESNSKNVRRFPLGYRIAGIAASLAIIVACYFTMIKSNHKIAFKDTYSNPQLAYAETKRALLYISEQLNKGTEPLSQVGKLNTGMEKLSSISSLSDGFERLEMVSKYYKTSKTEKQ